MMKKAPKFGPHPPKAPNFRHALDHMALYLPPILFLARGKVQLGVLAGTAGLQAHALIAKGPCPHRESFLIVFPAAQQPRNKPKLSPYTLPHTPHTTHRDVCPPCGHLSQAPSLSPPHPANMLWSRRRRKGLGSAAGAAAAVLLLLQVLAGPGVLTTCAHAPAQGHTHKHGTSIPKA